MMGWALESYPKDIPESPKELLEEDVQMRFPLGQHMEGGTGSGRPGKECWRGR